MEAVVFNHNFAARVCSFCSVGSGVLLDVYLEQSGQLLLHQSLDLLLAQGVWFTICTRVRVEGVHQDGHGRLQLRHGCRCWRGPKWSARTSLKGAEWKRREGGNPFIPLEKGTGSIGQVIVCFIRAVARTMSTQPQS